MPDNILIPTMYADAACKAIYSQLLITIRANEAGIFDNTDSEFLHDFRVAVRKTRAGLGQLKGVLPDSISLRYATFFAWLGQATSPCRDVDVYLLNFDRYKEALPVAIREDLNPLRDFLLHKQQRNYQELAEKLRSSHYALNMSDWEQYLQRPAAKPLPVTQANAHRPVKQLADLNLRKLCRRVLQEGDAITGLSSGDTFHELRKTCKKLRYLIEFFQTFYPKPALKELLNTLKGLQDVLGTLQDCQVHTAYLKQFRKQMSSRLPAPTRLAVEALQQILADISNQARQAFAAKFADFKQGNARALFRKH